MGNSSIIIRKKYIHLKQLLVDGKINLFEDEISKLQFDELVEFSYYAYKSNNEKDFFSNYIGVKVLGELSYLVASREIIILNSDNFEFDNFGKLIFQGLSYAANQAFELKYYQDAEKYSLQVIQYPSIEQTDYLSFLSILAQCANFKNDISSELIYCEMMMEIDSKDPRILLNYSYSLMRNKEYEKSKIFSEECLKLGYDDFAVYNQLAVVTMFGFKDYIQSNSYIETIFNLSHSGKDLTERNKYLLFHNYLTISGLSGSQELLKNIIDFKRQVLEITEIEVDKKWVQLAEICEFFNKGVFELENGNIIKAQNYFDEISAFNRQGNLIQISEFLNSICEILKDCEKINNIEDVKIMLDYIEKLEIVELFAEYKEIIKTYFQLLWALMLLIKDGEEFKNLNVIKLKLQNYYRCNLTTSTFMSKSFTLISLIEEYQKNYSKTVLKERFKQEYGQKLGRLIETPIKIANETTFLYSLNTVINVNNALCELIIKSVQLIQKNEPSFIKIFKSKKNSLLETDFRDIIYRSFGLSYDISISAESLSRVGRTDLQIESEKFGTKTFEFKIWGSNDYKDVVKQIYEYLTDFEIDGFIFMVNPNKNSIEESYIENLQREDMGYLCNSLEKKTINGFSFFISKHKINVNTKTIYHFIYNVY